MDQFRPQYAQISITRYEKIFGQDFVSTGGLQSTEALLKELSLPRGLTVLDAGCGLGGSAFYLARQYDAQVTGVDLLPQMIEEAQRRAIAYHLPNVKFVLGDILTLDLPQHSFDLVYSRDAFLHIHDKEALFSRLLQLVKPGGTLFFTDYARGPAPGSEAFEAYRQSNDYDLRTPETYAEVVRTAGFREVEVRDLSEPFLEVLRQERARVLSPESTQGANALTPEDQTYLAARWAGKIGFTEEGDMRWCSLRATG